MPGVLGEAILRKEPRMDTSRTYVGIDVAKAKLDIASSPPGLTTSKSADPETPEVPGAALREADLRVLCWDEAGAALLWQSHWLGLP